MPWMHKQLDKRKINSITLKFKGKERIHALPLVSKNLEQQQQKSQNIYTRKIQAQPNHKTQTKDTSKTKI
jgi:hypothetical protein